MRECGPCEIFERIREALLSWYDEHARDLPWRREGDPYRIWLSEVMLQQTQVGTVIPYYTRFLEAYPTLAALASAGEEEVLKLWEGLGYYARARRFLEAAREVQAQYGGQVPSDPGEFGSLPGVGPYTAAAVLSIAYGVPLAAVDGNVRRVVSRVFCLEGDPRKAPGRKRIRCRADDMLDPRRPGDFNQALMDLGAFICTPRNPSCVDCPLEPLCLAHMRDRVHGIPPKKRQKFRPLEEVTVAVVIRDRRCLVRRRPRGGLLGGLWEFATVTPGVLYAEQVSLGEQLGVLDHTFSHLRWRVSVYWSDIVGAPPRCPPWRWVTGAELVSLPFPAVYRPVIEAVKKRLDPGLPGPP